MFSVYVLRSVSTGRLYIGQTQDLSRRLTEHASGIAKYTRARGDFPILGLAEATGETQRYAFLMLDDPAQSLGPEMKRELVGVLEGIADRRRLMIATPDKESVALLTNRIANNKAICSFLDWSDRISRPETSRPNFRIDAFHRDRRFVYANSRLCSSHLLLRGRPGRDMARLEALGRYCFYLPRLRQTLTPSHRIALCAVSPDGCLAYSPL